MSAVQKSEHLHPDSASVKTFWFMQYTDVVCN